MPVSIASHLADLQGWFANCPFAIVALSGGVDSSLVSFLATEYLGTERSLSVISNAASLKRSDLQEASSFCERHRIPLRIVTTRELDDPRYYKNPSNRCFYCKQTLYHELQAIALETSESWIINGTNADDQLDYRPGLQAAEEFDVRSPLADCGISKQAVRNIAASLGLSCWDKPASPCLSSRVAYGQPVTAYKLRQIEDAETLLLQAGYPICRVRHYGTEARVEVASQDVQRLRSDWPRLGPALRALGFERVRIDEEGFVSGKLNRELSQTTQELPMVSLQPRPKAARRSS